MNNVKLTVRGLTAGMKDALKGAIIVVHLDRAQQQQKQRHLQHLRSHDQQPPDRCHATSQELPIKMDRDEEPRIMIRIFQCCILNGVIFWLSILVFNNLILRSCQIFLELLIGDVDGSAATVWEWLGPLLYYTFGALWVLPLFVLSKIVNGLWFQDIADSAYRYTKGRPHLKLSFSKLVADTFFSLLIQALFLVQGYLMSLIPIPFMGQFMSLLHMCLLYSLYAFEYKWFSMGWELPMRLSFIENNWPYFIGFGLPLAILTAIPSSYVISGCVFSILFPLFILSGNEAEPLIGMCDRPLQLFSPVVSLSNALFHQTLNVAAPVLSRGSHSALHSMQAFHPSTKSS